MMGRQTTDQGRFFHDFCLEDHVPGDHLLRQIDSLLDLSEVRQQLKPFYSHTGRPSVDPELMMRMLLVGYCYGIRSEPGWQVPAHNRPGPRRPDTLVPGEQTRLPALPVEAPMLPEHVGAQDPTRHQ